jgi:hypothetical protein
MLSLQEIQRLSPQGIEQLYTRAGVAASRYLDSAQLPPELANLPNVAPAYQSGIRGAREWLALSRRLWAEGRQAEAAESMLRLSAALLVYDGEMQRIAASVPLITQWIYATPLRDAVTALTEILDEANQTVRIVANEVGSGVGFGLVVVGVIAVALMSGKRR